ncbi:MAG: hypothetical protein AB7O96_14650 [Pseudobdellovibrionaceae bacterium]
MKENLIVILLSCLTSTSVFAAPDCSPIKFQDVISKQIALASKNYVWFDAYTSKIDGGIALDDIKVELVPKSQIGNEFNVEVNVEAKTKNGNTLVGTLRPEGNSGSLNYRLPSKSTGCEITFSPLRGELKDSTEKLVLKVYVTVQPELRAQR